MKKNTIIFFFPFFFMWIVTACGGKESVNFHKDSDAMQVVAEEKEYLLTEDFDNMSDEEKKQKYIQHMEAYLKETLINVDGIDDIDIEIVCDANVLDVDVRIDYSDSLLSIEDINKSVEASLEKFFPEGTNLSITKK